MISLFLAISAQVADVMSTGLVLGVGGVETNPLFGQCPNLWLVMMIKIAVIAAILFLLKGQARDRVLTACAAIGFGAAGWNLHFLAE